MSIPSIPITQLQQKKSCHLYLNILSPKSVLDIGCGNGSWLKVCKDLNVEEVFGVDGITLPEEELYIDKEEYMVFDLSHPISLKKKYDIVISLEVAEHLYEKDADTFIDSITNHTDVVLFSAAIPGQGGQYHFNEQWPNYWNEKFKQRGFEGYDIIRRKFWNNENLLWWYRQNTIVYVKKGDTRFSSYTASSEIDALVHPSLFRKKTFYPKFLTEKKDVLKLFKQTIKRLLKKG